LNNKVFFNNKICDAENANVSVFDRGYLFSDGIYELIPYFNKKPFLLEDHYHRLKKSLAMIGLKNPYEKKDWIKNIEILVETCEFDNFSLYIQVTRGVPKNIDDGVLREHAATKKYNPSVCMFCSQIQNLSKTNPILKNAITMEDKRWLKCDIKSISLLFNAYAKTLANDQGAYEAILVRNGIVTEGCSSNVFIVKDKIIKTAPKSNLILPGVTRSFVINELIKKNKYPIKIDDYNEDELINADEIFITNSTQAILPIKKINNKTINNGEVGKITEKLYKHFLEFLE
jgi:D-alanine transaminase